MKAAAKAAARRSCGGTEERQPISRDEPRVTRGGVVLLSFEETRRRRQRWSKKPKARIRDRLIARDGEGCQPCGATTDITIDHIKPLILGGSDSDDNLRLACRSCNSAGAAHLQPNLAMTMASRAR